MSTTVLFTDLDPLAQTDSNGFALLTWSQKKKSKGIKSHDLSGYSISVHSKIMRFGKRSFTIVIVSAPHIVNAHNFNFKQKKMHQHSLLTEIAWPAANDSPNP